MVNTIRRGLRILPHLFLMTALLMSASMSFFHTPEIPEALALAGDGTSSNIQLLDTNANGKIDRITFDIDNTNGSGGAETWRLQGSLPYGLSVTQTGQSVDISAVSISNASTATPSIQIDLNEADPDLVVDTNGVSTNAIELQYTQAAFFADCDAGTTDSICDTVDDQLNAITGGSDTGGADTEIDAAAPLQLTQTYQDASNDGSTEEIVLTFTETVFFDGDDPTQFSIANGDLTLFDDDGTPTSIAGSGSNTLTITTSGTTNLTGVNGGTEPTLAYTQSAGTPDDRVNDGNTNDLASYGATSLTDGAAPVIASRSYSSSAGNGTVDQLILTMTENTSWNGVDLNQFAIVNQDLTDFDDNGIAESVAGSGTATLTLTTTGTTDLTGVSGNTEPTVQFTQSGTSINIPEDAAGNDLNNDAAAVGLNDTAAPILVTRTYLDNGDDGSVDQFNLLFSESVTWNGLEPTQFILTENSLTGFAAGLAYNSGSGSNTINMTVTGTTNLTGVGTGTQATVQYNQSGTPANVPQDANTNALASEGAAADFVDGAKPLPLTATAFDGDANGTFDLITTTWTEGLSAVANGTADWAISSAADFAALTEGTVECNNGGAAATECDYNFTTTTTKTNLGDLELAFTSAATVTDGTNNADSVTFNSGSTPALTDGAAPVATSIQYQDNNTDGQVDQLVLNFTENTTFTMAALDWGFSVAGDINLNGDFDPTECAGSGTATITCTDAGTGTFAADANKTGLQTGAGAEPTWNYTNNSNNISDGTNNTATFSLALSDNTAPIVLTRTTADSDNNGQLDGIAFGTSEILNDNFGDIVVSVTSPAFTVASIDTGGSGNDTIFVANLTESGSGDSNATPTVQITTNTLLGDAGNLALPTDGAGVGTTDGAAPIITDFRYLDNDGNGQIDRVTVTFSEDVVAASTLSANDLNLTNVGDFTTAAFGADATDLLTGTVSSVTVNLGTESTVQDTNDGSGNFAISSQNGFSLQDANGNINNALQAQTQATVTDGAAPVAISASYQDNNTDGQVDEASVNFTENVSYTYLDTDWTATANNLTNFDVNACNSCTNVTPLLLTATADAGITGVNGGTEPGLAFAPGNNIADAVGNNAVGFNIASLADAAAPAPVSAQYLDTDNNGQVDRVDATFSENITLTAYNDADFTITPGTVNLANETNAAVQGGNGTSAVLQINSVGNTNTTGGAANPAYAYTNNANNLNDGNGNNSATFGAQSATDAAGPIILSADYRDTNADGAIDQVALATSADTGIACTAFAGGTDFNVTTAGTVNISDNAGDTCGTNGTNQVTVSLSTPGDANTTGGAVDPVVSYTQPGNGIEDGAGNDLVSAAGVTAADAAAPVPVSGLYLDTDFNGAIDRVDVTMSADTGLVCVFEAGDWTVPTPGDITVNTPSACATSGNDIRVSVSADANETGGTTNPTLLYSNQGVADQIQDGTGNVTATFAAAVTATDGASPIVTGAQYRDTNANGEIDQIAFNTSTDTGIACTAFTGGADFTVTTAGTVNVVAAGGDTCATNGTTEFNVNLATEGTADTTGGAVDPVVNYNQPGNGVEDGAGNDIGNALTITATDNAAPIALSSIYVDNDFNGTVDRIDVTMSADTGLACTFEAGDWSVPTPGTINVNTPSACAINGNDVRVSVSADANETGGATDPVLAYTNQGAADQLVDGNGNATATFAGVTATDGAGPFILNTFYKDSNSDGAVDRITFVTTADQGMTCTSFTGGADFTVTTAGTVNVVAAGGDTCGTNGTNEIDIDLATPGTALTTGGATDPVVNYVQPGNGVEDGVGNDVPTANNQTAADAAAPVPASALFLDTNIDGQVDRVDLTMSADVGLNCTFEAGDWSFPTAGTINVTAAASCTPSTNDIQLNVTADANLTGGATAPTILYTNQGTADQVVDGAGNVTSTFGGAVTINDGAAPYAIQITYTDPNNDGTVEQLAISWTEDTNFTSAAADWIFSTAGDILATGDFDNTECAGSGTSTTTCTDVDTGTFATVPNRTGKQTAGGTEPVWDYTNNANNVNDAAGNNTGSFTRTLVDTAAAIIVTRVTKDTDQVDGSVGVNDGSLNGILATFTEAMDASSVATNDFLIFDTGLVPLTEAYADVTDDVDLFFQCSDCPANQTGNLLRLQITGGDGLLDLAGIVAFQEAATSPATDGAAPIIVTRTYRDGGNDGSVETVELFFSEPVSWNGLDLNQFVIANQNLTGFDADGTPDTFVGGSGTATITMTTSGTTDLTGVSGATEPTIQYTQSGTPANRIQDAVNNALVTEGVAGSFIDGAGPIVLTRSYSDNGNDGSVDRLTLTFSESATWNLAELNQFAIVNNDLTDFDTTGQADSFVSGNNSATFVLATSGTTNLTGVSAGTEPTVQYTQSGTGANRVKDATGNDMTSEGAASAVTDTAAPVYVSSQYLDTNGDGQVDRADATYTENLTLGAYNDADWTMGAGTIGLNNETNAAIQGGDGASAIVQLTALGTADITGGVTDPTVAYTNNANNLNDGKGNNALSHAAQNISDAASPVFLSGLYQDPDGDGQVNQLSLTFTEVIATNTAQIGEFAYVANDILGSALAGGSNPGDTGANTITLGLGTNGNQNITSHTTAPTVTYTDAAGTLLDGAGNQTNNFGPSNLNDGAGPVITNLNMQDNNTDGIIDGFALTYSENLADTAAGANGFDVTSAANHGACAAENADPSVSSALALSFACSTPFTSVGDLTLAFTGNAGIQDAAANQAISNTYTAASSPAIQDTAQPVALSATLNYNNSGPNAKELVVLFSEVIDASTVSQAGFHINDITGTDDVTVSTATASPDGTNITFILTDAERIAALAISGVPGGNGGAVVLDIDAGSFQDLVALNNAADDDNNPVTETADTTSPNLVSWAIDFDAPTLTLTFDEDVSAATLDPTAITFQDAATFDPGPPAALYTLTGGTTTSVDGLTIVIDLTVTDVTNIRGDSRIVTNDSNGFMTITTTLIDDLASNDNVAIANGGAIQVLTGGITGNVTNGGRVRRVNSLGNVTVSAGNNLVTTENGALTTFEVSLTDSPSSDVKIRLTVSDSGEATVSPEELVFTPENGTQPLLVTVIGLDDTDVDGDQTFTIDTSAAESDDRNFNESTVDNIVVVNRDNDIYVPDGNGGSQIATLTDNEIFNGVVTQGGGITTTTGLASNGGGGGGGSVLGVTTERTPTLQASEFEVLVPSSQEDRRELIAHFNAEYGTNVRTLRPGHNLVAPGSMTKDGVTITTGHNIVRGESLPTPFVTADATSMTISFGGTNTQLHRPVTFRVETSFPLGTDLEVVDENGNKVFNAKVENGIVTFRSNVLRTYTIRPTSAASTPAELSDISGNPEEIAIRALMAMGIISGHPDGTFKPNEPLKRSHTSKLVALLAGVSPDNEQPGDQWYTPLKRALDSIDVTKGTVDPEQTENRANFIALIMKIKGSTDVPACDGTLFPDVTSDKWFCGIVEYAHEMGWLSENAGDLFRPSDAVSRAEASGILYRAFN